MKRISFYIIVLFLLSGALVHPQKTMAACNFHTAMTSTDKNVTTTTTCTIAAVQGVDNPQNSEISTTSNATITLSTGASITINNGGTLAVNAVGLGGGTIAIQSGGQIKLNTPLYVADADGDGWPTDFTLYTASASGRRR